MILNNGVFQKISRLLCIRVDRKASKLICITQPSQSTAKFMKQHGTSGFGLLKKLLIWKRGSSLRLRPNAGLTQMCVEFNILRVGKYQ